MQHRDWYCLGRFNKTSHVSKFSMTIPISCSFYIKVHVLMSHFTELPKQRSQRILDTVYFICNKCPPIDSKINQNNKKKRNVIR